MISVLYRSEGPDLPGPSQHRNAVVLWRSEICDSCILLTDHRQESQMLPVDVIGLSSLLVQAESWMLTVAGEGA